MKHFLFSLIVVLFLSACAVDSIPQDGLTGAVGVNGGSETAVFTNNEPLQVDNVDIQCAGAFVPGRTYARVTFRIATENETLGTLYGGGIFNLGENNITYDGNVPKFSCEGTGQLRAYQTNPQGDAALVDWLLELRVASLTAQIDGVMTPLTDVIVVGLAITETAQVVDIPVNNNNLAELSTFQCQGFMIPDSSKASITFTAENTDGKIIVGGGILETGVQTEMSDNPDRFQCNMEGEGQINAVFEPNDANLTDRGTIYLNLSIPSLQMRNDNGKQQIMFETFMTGVVDGADFLAWQNN